MATPLDFALAAPRALVLQFSPALQRVPARRLGRNDLLFYVNGVTRQRVRGFAYAGYCGGHQKKELVSCKSEIFPEVNLYVFKTCFLL